MNVLSYIHHGNKLFTITNGVLVFLPSFRYLFFHIQRVGIRASELHRGSNYKLDRRLEYTTRRSKGVCKFFHGCFYHEDGYHIVKDLNCSNKKNAS